MRSSTANEGVRLHAVDTGEHALLRQAGWPRIPPGQRPALTIVDLFSGCGGMTLGASLAALDRGLRPEVRLAVDMDQDARDIYFSNLWRITRDDRRGGPAERILCESVESLFDGALGTPGVTGREKRTKWTVGAVDLLLGGPPCQGYSNFNNHTRRDDPRNGLYARVARAAAVLKPKVVVIENVPAVVHDRGGVVRATIRGLNRAGYQVGTGTVLRLRALGVPQDRKRHFLVASRVTKVDPVRVESQLTEASLPTRPVEWAIRDLADAADPAGSGGFDAPPRPSDENRRRIDWLFAHDEYVLDDRERPPCHRDEEHSYKSVYGRLNWDTPAQTITTGFGSMGQGCYVHPSRRRTITPHEAARLQSFPDFFRFDAAWKRSSWARAIGNAVPPFAMKRVVGAILDELLP